MLDRTGVVEKRNMNSIHTDQTATNKHLSDYHDDFGFIDRRYIEHSPMEKYHLAALDSYQQLPFPSHKDEAWRRTSLRGLDFERLNLISNKKEKKYFEDNSSEYSAKLILSGNATTQVVNNNFASEQLIFTDFQSAAHEYPKLISSLLSRIVKPNDGKFVALTAAFAQQGVFLYVPKDLRIELPVYSIIEGINSSDALFSHLLIWLEEGASITYLHEYSSSQYQDQKQSFHGGIVELYIGENASLKFVEIQKFGKNVWSVTHERAQLQKNAHLDWFYGAFGSEVSKNFIDADLIGKNATANINGLYLCDGNQHIDLDTQQNHLETSTTSNLKFKGALFDESYAVWQGMVYVSPLAINTDGYQSNDNLILSGQAHARSIPGLEILADDVKCSHGATVSRLNDDELFYLQSRGITTAEAEKLIVKGFFSELTNQIQDETIKKKVEKLTDIKIESRKSLLTH